MKRTFDECREEYEKTSLQIQELYAKQRVLQKEMQSVCPHQQVTKVKNDTFLTEEQPEIDIIRYRCRDCFRYLTSDQLKTLREA